MPRLLVDAPGQHRRLGVSVVLAALLLAACVSQPATIEDQSQVTIFGPWRDEAADLFRASVAPFEEASGIDIVYTGSGDFETDIVDRAEGLDSPDIAIFPQPGLLNDLANSGLVIPLREDIAQQARDSYRDGVEDLVGSLSDVNGVVYRVNVKSLVWYSPSVFREQGYSIPRTWDEMEVLSVQMIADGFTPWCLGVEAFGASGWPGTDWIEDIVLRDSGTKTYDKWVSGEVPFTDDAIAAAFDEFADTVLNPSEVLGGRRGVLNTAVQDAQDPMFDDPPRCLMYRQASFQVDSLPEGTEIGPDGDTDVFVLPPIKSGPDPLVVGGTLAAAMVDRDETWETLEYLATAQSGRAWAEAGGFISPHAAISAADYPTQFDARMSALLDDAEIVRFDGSDLMDPRVGTESFFQAVLHFIGTLRLEEALEIAQYGYSADVARP